MDTIQMPCRRRAINALRASLKTVQEIPNKVIGLIKSFDKECNPLFITKEERFVCPNCYRKCKSTQGLRSHERGCK